MQSTGWTGLSEGLKALTLVRTSNLYERQWIPTAGWVENGNWDKEMEAYG